MALQKLTVVFGNESGETFPLEYTIRKTEAARLWAECISRAEKTGLRDKHRLTNFPGQERSQTGVLVDRLCGLISALKKFHPDLNFPEVDFKDLQGSINNLHFNFAHSHHVTQAMTEASEKDWMEFNVVLHEIEHSLSNDWCIENTGVSNANVTFTFNETHAIEIPEPSFTDFTVGEEFGAAYISYAHIGRHFLELFYAQDDQLADEHILPARMLSADTWLFFGPTSGHHSVREKMKRLESWFQDEARKPRFNRLGHFWGDPKLALGQIPVARLSEPVFTTEEANALLKRLGRFTRIERVFVT